MSGGILHPDRLESRQNRFFSEGESAAGPLVSAKVQGDCLTPAELSSWLDEQQEAMAARWLLEVQSRAEGIDGELEQDWRNHIDALGRHQKSDGEDDASAHVGRSLRP